MRILVVAATALEIPALRSGVRGTRTIDVLVTGVGMMATAAHAAQAMARTRYDAAFNFGVCGSFQPALRPGTVVHITRDGIADLGAEDGDRFLSLVDLGLSGPGSIENTSPPANDVLQALPRVRGITVNTAHGNEASIAAVVARCAPDVESMEGAGFAYACSISDVPYAQVRAVSNVVERRNRVAWRIDLAVSALNEKALEILDCA